MRRQPAGAVRADPTRLQHHAGAACGLPTCLPTVGRAARPAYIWSYGADFGEFGGVAVDAYVKDLPIARVTDDVLIAYEMNGSALPAEHGFPARLLVPGFYGTNSVKWLTRHDARRQPGIGSVHHALVQRPGARCFRRRDRRNHAGLVDRAGVAHRLARTRETIEASVERDIWGWAWADGGVRSVHIRADGGATWLAAELEPPRGREWQRFSIRLHPAASRPSGAGLTGAGERRHAATTVGPAQRRLRSDGQRRLTSVAFWQGGAQFRLQLRPGASHNGRASNRGVPDVQVVSALQSRRLSCRSGIPRCRQDRRQGLRPDRGGGAQRRQARRVPGIVHSWLPGSGPRCRRRSSRMISLRRSPARRFVSTGPRSRRCASPRTARRRGLARHHRRNRGQRRLPVELEHPDRSRRGDHQSSPQARSDVLREADLGERRRPRPARGGDRDRTPRHADLRREHQSARPLYDDGARRAGSHLVLSAGLADPAQRRGRRLRSAPRHRDPRRQPRVRGQGVQRGVVRMPGRLDPGRRSPGSTSPPSIR